MEIIHLATRYTCSFHKPVNHGGKRSIYAACVFGSHTDAPDAYAACVKYALRALKLSPYEILHSVEIQNKVSTDEDREAREALETMCQSGQGDYIFNGLSFVKP